MSHTRKERVFKILIQLNQIGVKEAYNLHTLEFVGVTAGLYKDGTKIINFERGKEDNPIYYCILTY